MLQMPFSVCLCCLQMPTSCRQSPLWPSAAPSCRESRDLQSCLQAKGRFLVQSRACLLESLQVLTRLQSVPHPAKRKVCVNTVRRCAFRQINKHNMNVLQSRVAGRPATCKAVSRQKVVPHAMMGLCLWKAVKIRKGRLQGVTRPEQLQAKVMFWGTPLEHLLDILSLKIRPLCWPWKQ